MPDRHLIFELRSSQDSESTPEKMAQLFATLPKLKRGEKISFEILSLNQSIFFLCFCPQRLADYLKSLLQASYSEILIHELDFDPIDHFKTQVNSYLQVAHLRSKRADYFPLKDYRDFTDIDPLATVLSTLSKSEPQDKILIQYLLKKPRDSWRQKAKEQIKAGVESKELIQKKINSISLKTSIRIMVSSYSPLRAEVLLENLSSAFQAVANSESNSLELKKSKLWQKQVLQDARERRLSFRYQQFLSVEELASIYHLPNKQLSSIPNIAWGKKLLGEPPEKLPIIDKSSPLSLKKDINPFAKAIYKNKDTIYGLHRQDRRRHMYVIGKTGTGKSTMLANMAINDLKNNEGLCVIDPHGDLIETLLNYIPKSRINDVIYFDPGETEKTVKINLFEGDNVQHRELIASGILSVFNKLYSYSWGPRLEYILRNALLTLLHSKNARLSNIIDLLTNQKYREKIVAQIDDQVLKNFWLYEFEKMPANQRVEAISPILNKIGQFVTSPLVRNVINASSSSFNIRSFWQIKFFCIGYICHFFICFCLCL